MSNQSPSSADFSSSGLGRIVFERKAKPGQSKLAIIALGLLVVCTLLVVDLIADPKLMALLCIVVVGFASVCVASLWYNKCKLFRCCENGVFHRSMLGSRSLRFDDLEAISYSAIPVFYHGSYLGTRIQLNIEPLPASISRPIKYTVLFDSEDEELIKLRDRVSQSIAERWEQQIQVGQSVAWTPNLKFLPGGIEYTAQGFVGKKEPVVIPYRQMSGYAVDDGELHVWLNGVENPAIKENTGRRNFFPGYVLFQWIVG
jgi:hypothetical protein